MQRTETESHNYEAGDARVVEIGDIKLADGRVVQGALLTFPAGPPALPLSVVWDGTPLILLIKPKPRSK